MLVIETLDSIDSTNSELLRRAQAGQLQVPSALRARVQTAGRGRQGRTWQNQPESERAIWPELNAEPTAHLDSHSDLGSDSPHENLALSLAFKIALPVRSVPALTLALGLALWRCLTALAPDTDFKLKWPNDVLVDGAKLAGILLEVAAQDAHTTTLIAGVGLNIDLPQRAVRDRPICDLRGLSLTGEFNPAWRAEQIAEQIVAAWLACIAEFERHGFASMREQWRQADVYAQRRLEHQSAGPGLAAAKLAEGKILGRALGPDAQGAYQLQLDNGTIHRIYAGDSVQATPDPAAKVLLLDVGNTRLKWAFADQIEAFHAIAHTQPASTESSIDQARWQASLQKMLTALTGREPNAIAYCCVAEHGPALYSALKRVFPEARLYPLSPRARHRSWRSGYRIPQRLGVDRIAAMLGAQRLFALQRCLIVVVGTAMTIDLLTADGQHVGGLIGASPTLIRQALRKDTAQLPAVELVPSHDFHAAGGETHDFRAARGETPHPNFGKNVGKLELADHTESAIFNASVWQCQALVQQLKQEFAPQALILSGGGALALQIEGAHHCPALILHGLYAWFRDVCESRV